jgi:hypothetical protein
MFHLSNNNQKKKSFRYGGVRYWSSSSVSCVPSAVDGVVWSSPAELLNKT